MPWAKCTRAVENATQDWTQGGPRGAATLGVPSLEPNLGLVAHADRIKAATGCVSTINVVLAVWGISEGIFHGIIPLSSPINRGPLSLTHTHQQGARAPH
jgi:hypothetical protein